MCGSARDQEGLSDRNPNLHDLLMKVKVFLNSYLCGVSIIFRGMLGSWILLPTR